MHIVLVTTSYPDGTPGSEAAGAFVADFAKALSDRARVSVVAAAKSTSDSEEDGVRVHRFAVPRWPLSSLRPMAPGDWSAIATTLRRGQRAVDAAVAADGADFILALWALPSGHWARAAGRRHRVPYGIWALGSDIWTLGRVPVLRGYLGRVAASADLCYADGLQLGRDVESISGRTCRFLPSSRRLADAAASRPVASQAPYRIAYLGRWHVNKGVDILLDALGRLSDDDWAAIAEVRIRGGGPLESRVHETAAALRSAGRPVDVGGYLDAREARELLRWCDVLALPSRIESIPVIFSDAAQLRRPLVATPVGDLPELFGRRAFGVLADAPEPAAYAAALRTVLATDLRQFDAALEAYAGEFDVAASARRFADDVGEVLP